MIDVTYESYMVAWDYCLENDLIIPTSDISDITLSRYAKSGMHVSYSGTYNHGSDFSTVLSTIEGCSARRSRSSVYAVSAVNGARYSYGYNFRNGSEDLDVL